MLPDPSPTDVAVGKRKEAEEQARERSKLKSNFAARSTKSLAQSGIHEASEFLKNFRKGNSLDGEDHYSDDDDFEESDDD